jgi:hypothetical protein
MVQRDGKMIAAAEADMTEVAVWNPTVQQVRDVVLHWGIAGPDFTQVMDLLPDAKQYVPTQAEVERVSEMAHDAVTAGRVIDFGYLPNDVLKYGGNRGGNLWQQGAIGMPFDQPWMLLHSWEGGVCVYLINPRDDGAEACELQPAKVGSMLSLLISDRGMFFSEHDQVATKYFATMAPAALRYQRDPVHWARANGGADAKGEREAAAGNVGDPLMAALLILSTRNVSRETVRAPAKLQKARAKNGKPPIPDYDRVDATMYVTAISLRGHRRERGEDLGGTHRSPVPHIRIGHPRQYATGRSIFIKDTLVSVTDEQRAAFKSTRSHYAVKP